MSVVVGMEEIAKTLNIPLTNPALNILAELESATGKQFAVTEEQLKDIGREFRSGQRSIRDAAATMAAFVDSIEGHGDKPPAISNATDKSQAGLLTDLAMEIAAASTSGPAHTAQGEAELRTRIGRLYTDTAYPGKVAELEVESQSSPKGFAAQHPSNRDYRNLVATKNGGLPSL